MTKCFNCPLRQKERASRLTKSTVQQSFSFCTGQGIRFESYMRKQLSFSSKEPRR